MKKRYSLILAIIMMLGVSACGNDKTDKKSTGISSSSSLVQSNSSSVSSSQITTSSSNTSSSSASSSVNKKVMEHVLFADSEVVYDGEGHTIEASVYPEGSTVTYTNAGPFVDVGEYEIKVNITHPDYEDYEDTAILVIKAATMSTILFEDSTLTYDGEGHTIEATGYPSEATVTYTNAGPFVNVGEYEIKVRIELANYEPYEETKKLIIEAADMDYEAIEFEDSTVKYDGNSHTIEATGYPSDATVTYTNAGPFVEVGEYEIGVKIEKENYNTIEKTATLKIAQGIMPSFEFEDLTVEYDGESHTIEATGYPEGSLVTYSNEGPYTEIGEYEIQVTVSHKNFETVTKTAKLNIVKPAETLKHLMYHAPGLHPYNISFNDETYTSGTMYTWQTSDFTFSSTIEREDLTLDVYYDGSSEVCLTIYAKINTEGFKVENVEKYMDNQFYVNYASQYLLEELPQFTKYYGAIEADYTNTVEGEVYAPANHKEMYYDYKTNTLTEVSGKAVGNYYFWSNASGSITRSIQGVEFTTAKRDNQYRYYYYLDENNINPGDIFYHYYTVKYLFLDTAPSDVWLSLVAFDKDGNETVIIGSVDYQKEGLRNWLQIDMPATSLMSSSSYFEAGIKSDFAGFYIGLMSADSVESKVTLTTVGIGNCMGEFM